MTCKIVKIGPKGQIVLKKEYREQFGILPGNYIETLITPEGILIRPTNLKKELEDIHKIREIINKRLKKSFDSVDAVREERR